MGSKSKAKPMNEKLLDIDLEGDDPTETTEGKEKLNSLVSTVSSLFKEDDSGKKKITRRGEPSAVYGELGLSTNKEDRVEIHHLLNSVIDKSGKIKKQIRKIVHKKLLPLPLNTPTAKKIERQVVYNETKKDISKWEPIVKKHREAPQLSFPLEKPHDGVQSVQEKFILRRSNPLKKEVDKLLKSSSHVVKKDKVLTEAEEKYLNQMSVEEARLRHAQLQKMRALISFQEAKFKRKAKIKSKKYHKLLKKEKLKKEMKEFEEMRAKNPDMALEKLNQLDKMRALERASLKHLNSGKWAKQNLLRAKYDPKTREDIKEQMNLNKNLLQKAVIDEEEESDVDLPNEDDDDNLGVGEVMMESDAFYDKKSEDTNPWLMRSVTNDPTPLLSSSDIIAENEKPEEPEKAIIPADVLVKQAIKMKKSTKSKTVEETQSKDKKDQKKETDPPKERQKDRLKSSKKDKNRNNDDKEEVGDEEDKEEPEIEIDPKKILNTTKAQSLQTAIPDYQEMGIDMESEDEDNFNYSDDDEGQRKLIAEAFDEDDVVAEFVKEKKGLIDRDQGKDIDCYLPGWGTWTGPGLRENARKKKRFLKKAERVKRKDEMLHNVIISENKDKAISKFMVKELPYNCKNIPEFERRYKTPIGPNWNPETQFRFNVEPKVITQLGKIIEPINEKVLTKPSNKRRPLDQVAKTLADVIPV